MPTLDRQGHANQNQLPCISNQTLLVFFHLSQGLDISYILVSIVDVCVGGGGGC
jgi:hypothetical protein